MPEAIRTASERLRSRPRRGVLAAFVTANLSILPGSPACAEGRLGGTAIDAIHSSIAALRGQEITLLAFFLALLALSLFACVAFVRARRAAERLETGARDEIVALQAETDRLKTLLLSDPQVLVTWAAAAEEPEILGDAGITTPGTVPERVLAFGTWLEPVAARRMEQAVDALRHDGRGFVMTLTTRAGRPMEAEGRAIGGRAVLRLRDLAARHDQLLSDIETMRALLDSLPAPVWARDNAGDLVFVNSAYAHAVEANDPADAVARRLELLDQSARAELARSRAPGETYVGRLPAIAAGGRRIFEVVDAPG